MVRKAVMLLVAAALLLAPRARAQVKEVRLRVDGLACPFCAYGVEKKLKALAGYRALDVRINEGKIIVSWRDDEPLDLRAIEEAIHKAGFTLRGVYGRVSGTVTTEADRYLLVLPPRVRQRFFLFAPGRVEDPGALGPDLRQRLDAVAREGKTVEVVGPVHGRSEEGAPLAISIEMLEVRGGTGSEGFR